MKIWKYIVAVWMTVILVTGFLIPVPDIAILKQTSRNLFFHVPMWFTMFACFLCGVYYSIRFLRSPLRKYDLMAETANSVGLMFGLAGLLTGSLWARFTWGTWWTFAEPRMNLSAMAMMVYIAYFVLRSAFDDEEKRGRLSAVYNIFAVTTIPFLLYIIPRQLPSLHPGAEGNPAFSEITAPELRLVFYPAIIGFFGIAAWMIELFYRYKRLKLKSMGVVSG